MKDVLSITVIETLSLDTIYVENTLRPGKHERGRLNDPRFVVKTRLLMDPVGNGCTGSVRLWVGNKANGENPRRFSYTPPLRPNNFRSSGVPSVILELFINNFLSVCVTRRVRERNDVREVCRSKTKMQRETDPTGMKKKWSN